MSTQGDDIFSLILDSQKSERQTPVTIASKKKEMLFSDWNSTGDGRLAIDVYDLEQEIVILAPMAGVDPARVDVHVHEDLLSIRGTREKPSLTDMAMGQYHAECYWGPFSRSIVLPADVVSGGAVAEYTHGLLSIRIPKAKESRGRTIPIEIVEE